MLFHAIVASRLLGRINYPRLLLAASGQRLFRRDGAVWNTSIHWNFVLSTLQFHGYCRRRIRWVVNCCCFVTPQLQSVQFRKVAQVRTPFFAVCERCRRCC